MAPSRCAFADDACRIRNRENASALIGHQQDHRLENIKAT
jgi:hypothetical protein